MAKKIFSKKQKKKAKRNNVPYANLQKKFHNLNVHEYIDYDYVGLLDEKSKAWLDKFTEEEYRAYFNNDKKKHINKKKNRKKIYDANNARNRCMYSRAKGEKKLDYAPNDSLASAIDINNNLTNPEDAIIEVIDKKKER